MGIPSTYKREISARPILSPEVFRTWEDKASFAPQHGSKEFVWSHNYGHPLYPGPPQLLLGKFVLQF